LVVDRGEDVSHIATCEWRSTLRGSKIVAETCLNFPDGRAEVLDVLLRDCGQHLHDDEPAQPRGAGIPEGRQRTESGGFLGTMNPMACRIEHHDDTPAIREAEVTYDGRRNLFRRASAVNHESAALKQSDADARAPPAAQVDRIPFDIE